MQEYKGDKLLRTITGEQQELMVEPMDDEATHRVIGKLPVRGSIVKLNGLEFIVKSMSVKQGTLVLEIRKPKHETTHS
jgi:hypothetical protein